MSEATFDQWLGAERDKLQRVGRYRTLEAHADPAGRVIKQGNRALINFSGNDYLGLANDARLKAAAVAALETHGVGSGAAQLLSGRSTLHEALEQRLAAFTGAPAALLFSSGYLANLGLIQACISRGDHVFHDRLNHASLIDAVTLVRARHHRYPHGDAGALNDLLVDGAACRGRRWVITESVFSMDGDIAPVPEIVASCRAHDAELIVDDAHGFGVLGSGRGVGAHFNLSTGVFAARVITFGKALGTAGAAVLGSRALIDHLVQRARTFIYDTAPPPALAAATLSALEILETDRRPVDRLMANIDRFRAAANRAGLALPLDATPIQPVVIGSDDEAVAAALAVNSAGFYVRAIRPPTVPAGTSRLRVCLSAAHRPADIDALVATLAGLSIPRSAA